MANTTRSRTENVTDVLYGRGSEKRLVEVAPADAMNVSSWAKGQWEELLDTRPAGSATSMHRVFQESGWAAQEAMFSSHFCAL
jgi:hypothetical protein